MKIVFICSALEPGCDGVGDYTRRLACEIIRQGFFAAAISFNDNYISDVYEGIQNSEGTNLEVLRLPANFSAESRLKYAKEYIGNINPTWLSLQFVIFGFNDKGLPFGLNKQLATLGYKKQWHIMFHELWLGMDADASIKHYLWGKMQRQLIKNLINFLKPRVINTQTQLYKQELFNIGVSAIHLPLFSNIANIFQTKTPSASLKFSNTKDDIHLVIFGNIHANAPANDFAADLANYSAEHKVKIDLTIIGRGGNEQKRWKDEFELAGITVHMLGEQSESNVSKILASSSWGISTTPMALIEKSGSVAAMHEHGLAVICVQFPWEAKKHNLLQIPEGIMPYKKGSLNDIFNNKLKFFEKKNISSIASQLINSFLNIK